ncbi:MAG: hypothetical protein B7733_22320 [Myxococcales bacterium FL481]|nr:MAG: hypothetical protein B7733_22320 [Myxococcales bacterium FL481]
MTTSAGSCDALEDYLADLDVDAARLRADPSGRSWLPPELFAAAQNDAHARVALRDYVYGELELHAAASPSVAQDPLFTARVLARLPRADGSDPDRRMWILGTCHALAVGVAYLWIRPALSSGTASELLAAVHAGLDQVVVGDPWWPALGLLGLVGWILSDGWVERGRVALPRR